MSPHRWGSECRGARIETWGAPYAEALRWVRGALDGLVHLHTLGVSHRGIKPSNLLIGPSGEAMLTDLGLAEDTVRDRITSLSAYDRHAAPEWYDRRPSSERSDIWAMGVSLYRLVTGHYPFAANDVDSRMSGRYVSPQTRNPQVTRCLTRIIDRALQPDPSCRYQRAIDMLGDLSGCRAVASWLPVQDEPAIESWAADLPEGRGTLRVLPKRRGQAKPEAKLDRGSGPRRVRPDSSFGSAASAHRAMSTIMRRSVQGQPFRE